MSEETAERLTGIMIGVVSITIAAILWLWLYSAQRQSFDYIMVEGIVFFGVVGVLSGTIFWGLFRHRLTVLLFHPTYSAASPGTGPRPASPTARTIVGAWARYPRWLIPAAGAYLLVLLYGLSAAGVLSATITFAAMAALAGCSLLVALITPDIETEDHRADLPITMVIVWAILYLINAGLFWPFLMAATWIAFIYGTGLTLFRNYSWWWIIAGLVILFLLNLILFFALYRP
jgi:hypothetical protein